MKWTRMPICDEVSKGEPIMKCYTHMLISEAVTDDLAKEVIATMQDHVRDTPGLIDHSILVEEDERMVILIMHWSNRQDFLTYHASRAYRQLIAGTQHMLL